MAVLSRRDAEWFTPPDSPREYQIAPLTFRERHAYRAELTREGGFYPTQDQILDALRAAIEEVAPDNAPDLIALVDAAAANPEDAEARRRVAPIEAACAMVPAYATLLAARQRYVGMLPWVAARHALRGWRGDDLPTFRRERGVVPDDLMDALPMEELELVGWRASALMQVDQAAAKNSAEPSPSPESPETSQAA